MHVMSPEWTAEDTAHNKHLKTKLWSAKCGQNSGHFQGHYKLHVLHKHVKKKKQKKQSNGSLWYLLKQWLKKESHILKKINQEALKVSTLVFCKRRKVYLFIYLFLSAYRNLTPQSVGGKNTIVEKQDTEGKHDETMPGTLAAFTFVPAINNIFR